MNYCKMIYYHEAIEPSVSVSVAGAVTFVIDLAT
jgi:hypothetical protein